MSLIKNPFRLLASDSIDSDLNFLRWFGPAILEGIDKELLWTYPVIIRSAPGAGKTSFLRLFTPDSLFALVRSKKENDLRALFASLLEYAVLDENRPTCLGILISCTKGFAQIEDLDLNSVLRGRLFYALLNCRMAIAFLRNACVFKEIKFPEETVYIEFKHPEEHPIGFENVHNGKDLLDWAKKLEQAICSLLDSFNPTWSEELHGADEMPMLEILQAGNVLHKGEQLAQKTLFMFDDVHGLAFNQRKQLLDYVIANRSNNVWFAERYEALTSEDILSDGSHNERDYNLILLEEVYQKQSPKKQESFLADIASRRIRDIAEIRLPDFVACFSEVIDEGYYELKIDKLYAACRERILSYTKETTRYNLWLEKHDEKNLQGFQKCLDIKRLEILILRDKGKSRQLSLFENPLDQEQLKQSEQKRELDAAHVMLSNEEKIPLYFSSEKITRLASSNILQFLAICAELFEELISMAILKQTTLLSAKDQHRIVQNYAMKKWKEMPASVAEPGLVRNLLTAVGLYLRDETLKPTAPYAPGATGVGLTTDEFTKVRESKFEDKFKYYGALQSILANCLKLNYLECRDIEQSGKEWKVFYLNRWICSQFDLPLSYGGWRPVRAADLLGAIETGKLKITKGKL